MFEDEDVAYVWIFTCPLRNEEGAIEAVNVLAPIAGIAGLLSFIPGISEKINYCTT